MMYMVVFHLLSYKFKASYIFFVDVYLNCNSAFVESRSTLALVYDKCDAQEIRSMISIG